jgi:hypothetical protein
MEKNYMLPNKANEAAKVDAQYRAMLILWFAFLSSIVMYLIVALVIPRPEAAENRVLTILFSAVSAFLVIVSFALKKKYLSRSVDLQQIGLVNTAYIAAAAFCEAAALIGLLDFFLARDRYYFVLIAISFVGQLLHFPRRVHLEAASFKRNSPLA